jgi:hypothetical protein
MNDAAVVTIAAVIFAVFICLLVWGAWRAFTPRGFALYFVMWLCGVLTVVCALHSTLPSSAPRRQANGIITWIVDHKEGKWDTYTFGLARANEIDLQFQAAATLPFFAKGHDLVSVTYLDEKVTGRYPRAIGFHVLTGAREGYDDKVSADWFGPWLGVLIGPPCGFVALWVAFRHKRLDVQDVAETNHLSGGITHP